MANVKKWLRCNRRRDTTLDDPKRNKRVEQIKKLIIALLIVGIILPISLCIALVVKVYRLQSTVDALSNELASSSSKTGQQSEDSQKRKIDLVIDQLTGQENEGFWDSQTQILDIDQNEDIQSQEGMRTNEEQATKVYLTFDDGPSAYTQEILDILKQYDAKATFFVIGRQEEQFIPLYKNILADGHTLGMHSFSHKYDEIYASEGAFWEDVDKLQNYLYETTGKWSRFYRFPGGSSNQVSRVDMNILTKQMVQQDIYYLDWNISCGDATGQSLSAGQIADNVTSNITKYQTAVVLMHDAADKHATVEALPIILQRLKNLPQVEILPVTEDMELIQHIDGNVQ